MKRFGIALSQSILTAFYWWLVTNISYGLFGGSRNPSLPPPDERAVMAQTAGTIVFAILLYAFIIIAWHKVFDRSRL